MKKNNIIWLIATIIISTVTYVALGVFCGSDWVTHAKGWLKVVDGTRPIGFRDLFFVLTGIFSFFQNSKPLAFGALCFSAAIMTALRCEIASNDFYAIGSNKLTPQKSQTISWLLALAMLIVYAIPIPNYFVNGYFFAGNFPTNVWNNSTTIAVFPFAILLFKHSYEQLTEPFSPKKTWIIFALCAINICIKPSYFFVFCISYPILCLAKFKLKKEFWIRILPVAISLLLLVALYFTIYVSPVNSTKDPSGVAFSPLEYYKEVGFLWELPITFIFCYLFPICYVISDRNWKKDLELIYATIGILIGIAIYLCFIETGPRRLHGNFQWQMVITSWILFFVCTKRLYASVLQYGFSKKNIFLLSIFCLHFLCGIIYLIKYFITGEPY